MNRTKTSNYVMALAGNPNTGKSTLFNALTGLRQHTGNWPGKTVSQARGNYIHREQKFTIMDLPGTYSLLANSPEEEIARDFICFANPDVTIVVVDATSLERNLNIVLQVLEITNKCMVCLNLMDEARRYHISIDTSKLAHELGVPVIGTVARSKIGLDELKHTAYLIASKQVFPTPKLPSYPPEIELAIAKLIPQLNGLPDYFNRRWIALRLLDGDPTIASTINSLLPMPINMEAVI